MENFEFYSPTKVFFGKETHNSVGEIIEGYGFKKILLIYGKGSIFKTGLYEQIVASLQKSQIVFCGLGGAEPNPKLSFVKKAVTLCQTENIEMILAVGGGSVIDTAKLAAVAVKNNADPWDFPSRKKAAAGALPVATILTLSASGSETSGSSVITNEELMLKRGFTSEYNRPLFSIMNPELTYTVDKYQTGCGIVDIMMHTLERYFSVGEAVDLTDRIAESLLKSVIAAGRKVIENPCDYEARATLMLSGSLSHNDLTGLGRACFLTVHQMEHDLSGTYDFVAHGAGLSVLFPAWAKYVYKHNVDRFCQYAVRVWDIPMNHDDPLETALRGILETENYFKETGMPTRLSELGIDDKKWNEMAEKCTFWGERRLPSFIPLGKDEIVDVFRLCE